MNGMVSDGTSVVSNIVSDAKTIQHHLATKDSCAMIFCGHANYCLDRMIPLL